MLIGDSARMPSTSTQYSAPTSGLSPAQHHSCAHRASHQHGSTRRWLRPAGVFTAVVLVMILISTFAAYQLGAFSQFAHASGVDGSAPPSTARAAAASSPVPAASTPSSTPVARGDVDTHTATSVPSFLPLASLSPGLAQYVDSQAGAMGVAIYDVTHDRAYGDDDDTTFTLASSAKVYILCGYLDMLERQGRSATGTERGTMARMIEYSDNNAAQWLYNHLGGAKGQQAYLARMGIDDYVPHGNSWGWARLSPDDMVRILALLRAGAILTPADTAYALRLLGHIERGTWGVGNTAPKGAHVYLKDGWVTGPDGKWAQNSSGIVVDDDETYIISVYTAHNPAYDWSKVQHVCAEVAELLTGD